MCHVSVFGTRPNIINFPSVSRLSWLAPESCRILVLEWDLAYLTFVFRPSICCRGMGGYTTILYGSWSEAGATWFGSVTDLQPRGWERGAGRPIGLEQQGKTLIQFSLSSHGEWKVPKTKKMNSRVVKKLPQKPLWIMKIWTWRPKLCDLVQYLYICILHLVISNIE